jgi:hypothetical protein
MKKGISFLIPILSIVFCFSFCKINPAKNELRTIDLSSEAFRKEEVKLSTIAKEIEYVFLETNSESIFASCNGIKVSENFIIVNDDTKNRLLLFSRQGTFLREISKYGKGPGEYRSVGGFTINEQWGRILIISPYQKKLLIFSINGDFISEMNVGYPVHYINDFGSSILLGTHFPIQFASDHYNIHFIDNQGKQLLREIPRPLKELNRPYEVAFNNRYDYYDTLCIWDGCFDTIFGATRDLKVIPRWRIINSDNYIGYEGFMSGKTDEFWESGKYYIGKILESKDFFFIDFSKEHKFHALLVDKSSERILDVALSSSNVNHGFGFINDLDGGFPIWPTGTCDEETLFTMINVFEMKEYLLNQADTFRDLFGDRLIALKSRMQLLTDLDNPILILIKTK